MLVRMTTAIGGYRNGEPWPPVGATLDVPDHEAADLIAAGYAEEATDAPTPTDSGEAPADDGDPAVADDGGEAPADEPKRRRARAS